MNNLQRYTGKVLEVPAAAGKKRKLAGSKEISFMVRAVKRCNKSSKRDDGISVLGDFQNLIGHDPEKSDLTFKLVLFLGRTLDWEDFHQHKLF